MEKQKIITNIKGKSRKTKIIAGSAAGSVIILLVLAFFLMNFFGFSFLQLSGIGSSQWKYDKKIDEPITALSDGQDITLVEIMNGVISRFIFSFFTIQVSGTARR